MKPILRLLLVLAVVFAYPHTASAQDPLDVLKKEYEKLYDQAAPSVVGLTRQANPREVVAVALGNNMGSGVVVSDDGYIMTTFEAIENNIGAGVIHVMHYNRKSYEATVVNADEYNNLVLLKADTKGDEWQPAAMGDSDTVKVGQVAMTLGNAFGSASLHNDPAFSVGIVSNRYLPWGDGNYRGEVIETDAAVNPGLFGGALVNHKGELIGITTDAISHNSFLGTAIPVNQVKRAWETLKDPRNVVLPGETGLLVKADGGALVIDKVAPGTAAATAGVEPGWRVVEVAAHTVTDLKEFNALLGRLPGGTSLPLRLAGKDGEQVVTLAVQDTAVLRLPEIAADNRETATLGCLLKTAAPAHFGVQLGKLEPRGTLEAAGLKEGDVITRLNNLLIKNPEQLTQLISKLPASAVIVLSFERDGKETSVEVRLRSRMG